MKTLTEFSGVVLRKAAATRDDKQATGLEGEELAAAIAGELGVDDSRVARLLEALDAAGKNLDSIRLVRVYQGEAAPPRAKTVGEFHYVVERLGTAGPAQSRGDDRGRGRGKPGKGGRDGDKRRSGPGGPGRSGPGRPGPGRSGPPRPGDKRRGRSDEADLRPGRGEKVPSEGEGWSLTRAPQERGERRGPRREGRDGEKRRPRRDKPRENRRDKPGGQRAPRDGKPPPAKRGSKPPRRDSKPRPPRPAKKPAREPEVLERPTLSKPQPPPVPRDEPPPPAPDLPERKVGPTTPPEDQRVASSEGGVQRRKRRTRPRRGRDRRSQRAENVRKPADGEEIDGNVAPPSEPEPNGNTIPSGDDVDDSFGNR